MSSVHWQPGMTLDDVEKLVILKALQFFQGHREQTARSLGITAKTLRNKLALYNGEEQEQDESENSNSGVHVEPAQGAATERSVSMQEREEVQEVSPEPSSGHGANKRDTKKTSKGESRQ